MRGAAALPKMSLCETSRLAAVLHCRPAVASAQVIWIASFPGAVIDGVSFVDCIFRGVRSTEVVEVGGSILFRKTGREGPKFELAADVAVSR